MTELRIPSELLPADGRFGSGPSKVRPEAVAALTAAAPTYLGTSHRQERVRAVVRHIRRGLGDLFALPDGYEVVLGNGGATTFWDVATFALIERRSQHLVFGEFSSKFAAAVAAAPHLEAPQLVESEPGTHPLPDPDDGIDVYALTHNETSTGVMMSVRRVPGDALTVVDATSAAGGLRVTPAEFDVYYFAPQKSFASDGGLWLAICSPRAVARIERLRTSGRWVPPSLDLGIALDNARLDQTYNTPPLATLFLIAEQVEWFNSNGGLEFAAGRCDANAAALYEWAERAAYATPFVKDPDQRSRVVGTIDLDPAVDALQVAATLRANGVLDTEPYRKLGRNQLRIALFPAIEVDDVVRLTLCVDYIVAAL